MLTPVERDAAVDAFFAATGAKIKHGGSKCYYVPSQDFIQIVPIEAFKTSHGITKRSHMRQGVGLDMKAA